MGSKKKKTTQTYTPPSWVEGASRNAVNIGQRIAGQQYRPYEGQRVAGLSENEQQGMQLARDSVGIAQPYYNQSAALTERGTQQFADADMQAYMNPYIKGALDPAAREIREYGAREMNALDDRSSSISAFGGSRGALMRSEALEKTQQSISDLYKTGLSEAYDRAVSVWGDERARDLQAAGRFQELGGAVQNAAQTDISTLMASGAVDRNIQQAMMDFDYSQFIEGRDWDFRSLGAVIAALEGTKGSYSTTQKTTSKESGGGFAQALGVGAALLGTFFNPASALTGAAGATGS